MSREQLELFVRNSSDIDVAQRFIEFSQEISTHPLQPHLLFHSSKLNEQRANLLKSASTHKSLKDMNDDLSLHEFFPEIFTSHSKSALKPKEILRAKSPIQSRPRSIHIEHRDRKYRITFLKDSNQVQSFPKLARYGPATNENLALMTHRNHQSLFGTDSSTVQGLSTSTTTTSKIHRESQLICVLIRIYKILFIFYSFSAIVPCGFKRISANFDSKSFAHSNNNNNTSKSATNSS